MENEENNQNIQNTPISNKQQSSSDPIQQSQSQQQVNQQPNLQTSQTPNAPQSPKNKSLKFLFIASVIILSLAISGTGYFYFQNQKQGENVQPSTQNENQQPPAPTTNLTADWETHIDREANLIFKYPPSFFVENFEHGAYAVHDGNANLYIGINPVTHSPDLCWELVTESSQNIMQGEITAEQSLYNIDCSWPGPQGRRRMETAWTKDNNEYIISLEYYEDEEEKYLKILNQILSTLEFINQGNTISAWEKYQNTTFLYSFEYPSAYKFDDRSTNYFNQLILTNTDNQRRIVIEAIKTQNEELPFYPMYTSSGVKEFGTISGKYYIFPDGYCDAGACLEQENFIGIVAYNNSYRYVFKLYGDIELNNMENQILSTFEFSN